MLSELVSKEDIPRRTLMQSEVKEESKPADTEKGDSKEVITEKNQLESDHQARQAAGRLHRENLPFSITTKKAIWLVLTLSPCTERPGAWG